MLAAFSGSITKAPLLERKYRTFAATTLREQTHTGTEERTQQGKERQQRGFLEYTNGETVARISRKGRGQGTSDGGAVSRHLLVCHRITDGDHVESEVIWGKRWF